jgi:3',5'-cyclic-AMP phosphodiesterase
MTTSILWATDTHTDHMQHDLADVFGSFCDAAHRAQVPLLITGDISNGKKIMSTLRVLDEAAQPLGVPWYFVLGNHDYYGSSIKEVRQDIGLFREHYLPMCQPVKLADDTYLVGVDGWYDTQAGVGGIKSKFLLNDFRYIKELAEEYLTFGRNPVVTSRTLAENDNVLLLEKISRCVELGAKHVIIGTHVPPFREAALYQNMMSDDNAAPWFVNKSLGDRLKTFCENNQDVKVTVLCGHTHHPAYHVAADNLKAVVQGAQYGHPQASHITIELTHK